MGCAGFDKGWICNAFGSRFESENTFSHGSGTLVADLFGRVTVMAIPLLDPRLALRPPNFDGNEHGWSDFRFQLEAYAGLIGGGLVESMNAVALPDGVLRSLSELDETVQS